MSPRPAPRRARLVAAASVAGVALLLSGCGAGQVASTTSQVAAVNGGSGSVQMIQLRDVVMAYPEGTNATWPAGADVPVFLTIVNNGNAEDTLVGVSTPAAESVSFTGELTIPSKSAVAAVEPGGAEPGAGGEVELFAGTMEIELEGLRNAIASGLTAEVTFTFQNAGPVTVPVGLAAAEYERTDDGTHDGLEGSGGGEGSGGAEGQGAEGE